jgi:homospermidine synthase
MITRIARHRSAHRAFCQSVNAKLTVPSALIAALAVMLERPEQGPVEGDDQAMRERFYGATPARRAGMSCRL